MPNRVIKESIKRSAQVDSLTWFEEVVFYRLIVTADDYGCVDGRTVLLKNDLFPLRDNITRKAIDDAISKLVSVGLLCTYTVNDMPYLFFPTWEKHQRIRNKRRKYPEPPYADLTVNCRSNDSQTSASYRPESESNPNPNPESEDIGAEQPAGRSTPAPAPSDFDIPLNDGSAYNVPLKDIATYRRLYPAVDVEAELRGMIGWCLSNPKRRKTSAGVKGFITRWLKKTQDAGGTHRQIAKDPPRYADEDDFY